jgi:hypothetical protein
MAIQMARFGRYLAALMLLLAGGCAQTPHSVATNPAQEYLQRSDKITLSAGNAKEVNSNIQVIDPWPQYVGNTRIPGNGERMAGAVERYRDVSKQNRGPQPLPTVGTTSNPSSNSAGGSGASLSQ